MRKAASTLSIVLAASAILGLLGAVGYAGKPSTPKPVPTQVAVTGGIEGAGTPAAIRVSFLDGSFASTPLLGLPVISNPDAPLTISSGGANSKTLMYCYCVHPDHRFTGESICDQIPSHDPYYYCLWIHGGVQRRKSTSGEIAFPAGSFWHINSKVPWGEVPYQGTLDGEVRYNVTEWSTSASSE